MPWPEDPFATPPRTPQYPLPEGRLQRLGVDPQVLVVLREWWGALNAVQRRTEFNAMAGMFDTAPGGGEKDLSEWVQAVNGLPEATFKTIQPWVDSSARPGRDAAIALRFETRRPRSRALPMWAKDGTESTTVADWLAERAAT